MYKLVDGALEFDKGCAQCFGSLTEVALPQTRV